MTDMIENCCFASPSQTEPDTQTITRRALLAVLPMVLEQELSPRQRTCLRAFYVDGKRKLPGGWVCLKLRSATISMQQRRQPTGCCTTAKLPWPRPMTAGWKQRTTDSDPSICTDDTAAASL